MTKHRPLVFKLDGVVRDFVKNLNIQLEKRDLINYDYADWYMYNKYDKNCDEIANNPIFWKNLHPFDDAWYQINYYFNQSVPVFILSDGYNIEKDEQWLDSWRIQYDKVISTRYDYIGELKQINPSLIIHDIPDKINLYRSEGLNGILRRAWYNRDKRDSIPNIGNFFDIKVIND